MSSGVFSAYVTSVQGQSRRLNDVGMSASPPTTDVSLRRSEPTLWAINGADHSNAFRELRSVACVPLRARLAKPPRKLRRA